MQTTVFVLVMNALVIACAVKTETWRMRIVSHALATQVEDIAMTYLPIGMRGCLQTVAWFNTILTNTSVAAFGSRACVRTLYVPYAWKTLLLERV